MAPLTTLEPCHAPALPPDLDLAPGQTLYPIEPRARADVNRWLFWCGSDFAPGIGILDKENSIKALIGAGPSDPAEVARGERLVLDAAALLDAHLAQRAWVCGAGEGSLSLADYALAAPLADEARARLPIGGFPNLQRWLGQAKALAAWKACEVQGWDVPADGEMRSDESIQANINPSLSAPPDTSALP